MKRWKLVRSMLKNLGYSQVESDDTTFDYIDRDGNIYFTTKATGVKYKAKYDLVEPTPVEPTTDTITMIFNNLPSFLLEHDMGIPLNLSQLLSSWNTFFDTTAYADTSFTNGSMDTPNNTIILEGATNLTVKANLFKPDSRVGIADRLISFIDTVIVTSIEDSTFSNCLLLTSIDLPAVNTMGTDVFDNIIGNIITLTIPATLNGDANVIYLEENNTVTIINP